MTPRPRSRGWVALLALLAFAGIAAVPWIHASNTAPPWVAAVKGASPVRLPKAPPKLTPITLPSVAEPIDPGGLPAKLPSGDANFLPTLVTSESNRLTSMLESSLHMASPGVVDFAGSVATLVLPGRPAPYDFSDLVSAGAVIPWHQPGTYMLLDSVFVAPAARLEIGGDGVRTLLMNTSPGAFTSIVTWEGTLSIAGTAASPINITGWNNGPATNPNYGRPYIRAVGGDLDLTYVRASSLGFWSGVTGGVSWTATNYRPATGGASDSRFIGDTYGAFVEGAEDVQFSNDLFESNQVDGLRLHRDADNSTVTASAAVRNGANGFVISRGSHDVLRGDVALHNTGNGFLIDAQPLVSGASPSGGSDLPSAGLVVTEGEAEGNGGNGILLEGGLGTVLTDNLICGASTAIAIRLGATDTSLVGNDVRCGKNVALSIGPGVIGTMVSDNTLSHSQIGIIVLSSPLTHLLDNRMTSLTVFGLSVRGTSPGSAGSDNVIAGRGFEPIQITYGTKPPSLVGTNLTAWQRRSSPSVLSYLFYHPLLLTWLVILSFVGFFCIVTRLRRRPRQPYAHVLPWQTTGVSGDVRESTVGGTFPRRTAAPSQQSGSRAGAPSGADHDPPDPAAAVGPVLATEPDCDPAGVESASIQPK